MDNLVSFSCLLQEKDARDIEIPNIKWEVFELMMRLIELPFMFKWGFLDVGFYILLPSVFRFIYTGSVTVTRDIAQDLLRAADQYLLEGLKRLCEYSIAQVD